MDHDLFGIHGTPLVFTCKVCGNELDITKEDENWEHECFSRYNRSDFVLLSDKENRIFLMTLQNYNEALAEGSVINVPGTPESDNSVSIVEEAGSSVTLLTTNSIKTKKTSNKKNGSTSAVQYEFSDEEKEAMIEAVHTRTVLWNFVGEKVQNRTRVKAGDAWKSATLEIGLPVEMTELVKAEWEKLRKAFWKSHRKYKESQARPSGVSTDSLGSVLALEEFKDPGFKFFQNMTFIAATGAAPPTVNSLPGSSTTVDQAMDHYKNVTSKLGAQTPAPKRARQSNSPNMKQQGSLEEAIIAALRNDVPKPHDGVTGLMLMIEEGIRKFPEDRRMTVGARVINLLEELKREFSDQ